MVWSERLIKIGDSWFSVKSISVERIIFLNGVKHFSIKGPLRLLSLRKLRIHFNTIYIDRLWAIRSSVKRETAQIES